MGNLDLFSDKPPKPGTVPVIKESLNKYFLSKRISITLSTELPLAMLLISLSFILLSLAEKKYMVYK